MFVTHSYSPQLVHLSTPRFYVFIFIIIVICNQSPQHIFLVVMCFSMFYYSFSISIPLLSIPLCFSSSSCSVAVYFLFCCCFSPLRFRILLFIVYVVSVIVPSSFLSFPFLFYSSIKSYVDEYKEILFFYMLLHSIPVIGTQTHIHLYIHTRMTFPFHLNFA